MNGVCKKNSVARWKLHNQSGKSPPVKEILKARRKEILLLCLLALLLGFSVWKFFYDDKASEPTAAMQSETEKKLSALLSEIDGVGEAEVMICETEEGVQSVVIVCSGANDLQVMMDVREAVSAALGTDEKSVKIYLKKK